MNVVVHVISVPDELSQASSTPAMLRQEKRTQLSTTTSRLTQHPEHPSNIRGFKPQ